MIRLIAAVILPLALACARPAGAAAWFDANEGLRPAFAPSVWRIIVRAAAFDDRGDRSSADASLRLARRITEEARPFIASSWPKGWPADRQALAIVRTAPPDALVSRIIGDFAAAHGKNKEAIRYFSTYLERSLVPDARVRWRLASLYQAEELHTEALTVCRDLLLDLEGRSWHGAAPSALDVKRRIRSIELRLAPVPVYTMDVSFTDIPEYIPADFNTFFKKEVRSIPGLEHLRDEDFRRLLAEEGLAVENLRNDERLGRIGRMMNARWILAPDLARVAGSYALRIRVFDPRASIWTDTYEYGNADFRYLPNLAKRFVLEFQGLGVPGDLLLPESRIVWNLELDAPITDIHLSADGSRIVATTESGAINVISDRGSIIARHRVNDRAMRGAVAPDGGGVAWSCLNGVVYYRDLEGGRRWKHPFKNVCRTFSISRGGAFSAATANNRLWYVDGAGEIFWDRETPWWITASAIADDASMVALGGEGGELLVLSEDGNRAWDAKLPARVVRLRFSPKGGFLSAETDGGDVQLFGRDGKQVFAFKAGEDKPFPAFTLDALHALTGRRGAYLYLLSPDSTALWSYQIADKVLFLESSLDGRRSVTVRGKTVCYMVIDWK